MKHEELTVGTPRLIVEFISGSTSIPLTENHRFTVWQHNEERLAGWKAHFNNLRFYQKTAIGKCRKGWALFLEKEVIFEGDQK